MSSSISSAQSTLSGAAAINSAAEATNLSQLMSEQAIWLVPVTLVAVQFFLKLFVAESPSFRQAWKSLIHSPVDVGFLALSFIATVIMGSPNSTNGLLAPMFGYIVLRDPLINPPVHSHLLRAAQLEPWPLLRGVE